jgi:hypothetical protein
MRLGVGDFQPRKLSSVLAETDRQEGVEEGRVVIVVRWYAKQQVSPTRNSKESQKPKVTAETKNKRAPTKKETSEFVSRMDKNAGRRNRDQIETSTTSGEPLVAVDRRIWRKEAPSRLWEGISGGGGVLFKGRDDVTNEGTRRGGRREEGMGRGGE